MNFVRRLRQYTAGLATILVLGSSLIYPKATSAEEAGALSEADGQQIPSVSNEIPDYSQYRDTYSGAAFPQASIEAVFLQCQNQAEAHSVVAERDAVSIGEQNAWCTWTVQVPETGCYLLRLDYYALPGKGEDIQFALNIDGTLPFSEASRLTLSRIWQDQGRTIEQDANGNDLRPTQVEISRWQQRNLMNDEGYYDGAYAFYLTEGIHEITLKCVRESMAVSSLTFLNEGALLSYDSYGKDATPAAPYLRVYQAENALDKSSSMLYPTYDRSSPATEPSHYSRIRLNTIGQSNWSFQGQWIRWEIEAPENGWYEISFKARQNYQQGMNSYRTLLVDGEIPFEEAKNICFPYKLNWYMQTLGDGETPYRVYLEKGPHTLTLEIPAGPMADVLKGLNDNVRNLNAVYRSIIMVTGVSPDLYRTFYLDEEIPGLLDNLREAEEELNALYNAIVSITGTEGSQASIIKEMGVMVRSFIDEPLKIPARLTSFKDNIEALGSLILLLSQQPLELDYIVLSSSHQLPRVDASFWESLTFGVQSFFASFVEDYNSVGNTYDGHQVVDVWISNGRDQAQILKNLIDNEFTPEKGIAVNLSIVNVASGMSQSTLVQATLAGKGPDVAICTPMDIPINLAMRGALQDLSEFDDFPALTTRFLDSAWTPFQYNGGVYAVPETQDFDMLFYRSDIFAELDLQVPETWDDFYAVLAILQHYNLQVGILETNSANAGISSGISVFEKFLLQNGGTYYNSELNATAFDTQIAYEAFTQWTQLYTTFGLDRSFDFFNRFRTGEMPLAIMAYSTYNQLQAAAPEIRGLWSIAKIPGTRQADGSIDRSETSSGNAAVLLSDAKDKNAAFTFIDWWTSNAVQARYGNELEAVLGVAARYTPANIEAFSQLAWTDEEAELLRSQWREVCNVPQIPGNYFISRCLTNAFRSVVDMDENPVRALNRYNKDMNSEITRKRREFNLEE